MHGFRAGAGELAQLGNKLETYKAHRGVKSTADWPVLGEFKLWRVF